MTKDELSAAQAAEFLGLSVMILRRQARNGVIPARKQGRRWVFSRARLKEWLHSGGAQVSMDVDESPWGR
jgi:excisionase family DNA binding protein